MGMPNLRTITARGVQMTPEARRVAVRLLLDTYGDFGLGGVDSAYEDYSGADESFAALTSALADLERAAPKTRAWIGKYVAAMQQIARRKTLAAAKMASAEYDRHQERYDKARELYLRCEPPLSPEASQKLEDACDWLADRMPERIRVLQFSPFASNSRTVLGIAYEAPEDLDAGVKGDLIDAWDDVPLDADEDDDDWSGEAPRRHETQPDPTLVWAFPSPDGADGTEASPKNSGYWIEGNAASWQPAGRPASGSRKPARALELLLERCPARTIEELQSCLGRGRSRKADGDIRAELKTAVKDIRTASLATPDALAQVLACDVRTVQRLAA
jgi:hypothetical protein